MDAMDHYSIPAFHCIGAVPRNLESEHQSYSVDHGLYCIKNQGTKSHRDDPETPVALNPKGSLHAYYKMLAKSSCEELKIGSGCYGEVDQSIAVKGLSGWMASYYKLFYQLVPLLRDLNCKYDTSSGWRKRPHHSHRNHTVQFSYILSDENLEPGIYDTDVSRPFDQNHIRAPEFISQMDPICIFDSGACLSSVQNLAVSDGLNDFQPAAIGVAKGQIIERDTRVWCPLLKIFLFGKEIKVPVSWLSLNQKTRYLKRNGTFRRCSSLLMQTETPAEEKTVANGNGKGADNVSSEQDSSYQAHHGLNASTEKPFSQNESSTSRPDETATLDISRATPSRKLESTWYIVSAAAHHMTGVLDLLTNYTPMSGELDVHTPSMGRMQVIGSGSVNSANITLEDVWYVPGLDSNLVSTSQLTMLGHTVSLGPNGCCISKDSEDGALVGSAHFTDDDLCAVDFLNVQPTN